MSTNSENLVCQVCGKTKKADEIVTAALIRPPILDLIQKEVPNWSHEGSICVADLNRFRAQYVQNSLEEEKGELTEIDHEVLKSLREQDTLSRNINDEYEKNLTIGQRIADHVAVFGGSWKFIISFGIVLALWVIVNSLRILFKPFDPYPFIFLNLLLSCLAAIQAPVIMMSQNRQESRDRLRGENDYRINLKAELEIRHLNEKMEYLITKQWQRLLEIQQIQIDLAQELIPRKEESKET